MKYQTNYSKHFPAINNVETRQAKARKILQSLLDYMNRTDLAGLVCLDMGCSAGVMSEALQKAGGFVAGIDIDYNALIEYHPPLSPQLILASGDAGQTPFADQTFDIIVCSQVYEHVPDSRLLFAEIARLLKPGGVCYFSGPNRLALIEEHYHLPFLSWFPRPISNFYVRVLKKGTEYYEKPLTFWELKKRLSRFSIIDLTPRLLVNPQKYGLGSKLQTLSPFFKLIPVWLWGPLAALVPNFNWILVWPT